MCAWQGRVAPQLKPAPTGSAVGVEYVGGSNEVALLPDLVDVEPTDARPSVVLIGGSGTGKTHALGSMMAAGMNVMVLAVEPKLQTIARYKPKVLFIDEPIAGKAPTPAQRYDRLMRFVDALGEGKYREHNGRPFDLIATDGLLEVGHVIYTYWKMRCPTSSRTGEQNTFALWDNVAERARDFFRAARDAAGLASSRYGLPPIGFVTTCGEAVVKAKTGEVRYEPLFPGNKAPQILPYMFEVVLRFSCRNNEGNYEFVAHTIGTEEFYAKCPPGLFDPEVINPNFGEMYDRLTKWFQTVADATEGVA